MAYDYTNPTAYGVRDTNPITPEIKEMRETVWSVDGSCRTRRSTRSGTSGWPGGRFTARRTTPPLARWSSTEGDSDVHTD